MACKGQGFKSPQLHCRSEAQSGLDRPRIARLGQQIGSDPPWNAGQDGNSIASCLGSMVWCGVVKQVAAGRRIGDRSSMRRSEQLQRERDSVAAFRDAHPSARWHGEVQRRRFEAARAAGAAMVAEEASKARMVLKPPPNTGQPAQTVQPIRAWESALEPPNLLKTDNVLQTCEQVIGMYDARIARARWQEQSFAGRVVRLFSLPYEARALAAEWFLQCDRAAEARVRRHGRDKHHEPRHGPRRHNRWGLILSWSLIQLGLEERPAPQPTPSVSSTTLLPTTTT
jgi:hypothetical protein